MTRSRAPIVAAIALACASGLLSAQVPQGVETFDAAWTIIKNTHFDKTMNGLDWNAVRAELEPKAAAAKTPAELRAVIRDIHVVVLVLKVRMVENVECLQPELQISLLAGSEPDVLEQRHIPVL